MLRLVGQSSIKRAVPIVTGRRLKNLEVANLSDRRRSLGDQAGDVLGQQGPGNAGGNIAHELRRNLHDELVRRRRKTVFVTDAHFHDGRLSDVFNDAFGVCRGWMSIASKPV